MKTQLVKVCFVSILLIALNACSSIPGMSGGSSDGGVAALVASLTSQLGVNKGQAMGGAAALFGLAKNNLSSDDFSSVANALPGVSALLGKIPGSDVGKGGMAGVTRQFSKLGMDAGMVDQFVPVVLNYAKSSGGENVMSLLQGAFK